MPHSIQCREGHLIFFSETTGAFECYKWISAPRHENIKDLQYHLMKWATQMTADALEVLGDSLGVTVCRL